MFFFWKNHFGKKYSNVLQRLGRSKNHKVFTLFKSLLISIEEKERRFPIHIQAKVGAEIRKFKKEGHIEKLDQNTSDQFEAPVFISAKKDGRVKLAMDVKPMTSKIYKIKFKMPNLIENFNSAAQIITTKSEGAFWFQWLDLKNAFGQLPFDKSLSKQCNFSILCVEFTGTYRIII